MPRFKQLCQQGKWDQAFDLLKGKIPQQCQAVYVNPFVPLGDLGIYPYHFGDTKVADYRRCLDLDRAMANISYTVGGLRFTREYFVSLADNIIAINIKCDRAAGVSGEISLYRVPDRECRISGLASLNELVLEGKFEEGVRFAGVVRVINRGGRLTGGIAQYLPPDQPGQAAQDNRPDYLHPPHSHWFRFRNFPHPSEPRGISTCFDSADEVVLLIAMATDHEQGDDPVSCCRQQLDTIGTDYERMRDEHIQHYQRLYRRNSISLAVPADTNKSTPELIEDVCRTGKASNVLYEQLFNFVRYLAIAAGHPVPKGQPYKAPINLQGIWNQDLRPAWDCDYHLDLNLEMCYWTLPMANMPELTEPLVDWAYAMLPQAQEIASDVYGVGGAVYTVVADAERLGNCDDLLMWSTGVSAWLAQILWIVWEYNHDTVQFRHKIYPVLRQIGRFYEEFLTTDEQGRLIPVPSSSPEICPVGRKWGSSLSCPSTFDLELIRQVFSNLLEASCVLNCDRHENHRWSEIIKKLPQPTLDKEGRLLEWLDMDYEVTDPGHRHRGHFVGFCPGDRITAEDTPEYNEGIKKALVRRHSYGENTSCSFDKTWDAQIYARLYDGTRALDRLNAAIMTNTMDNLLMSTCDWRDRPGSLRWFGDTKVFQIEASFGILGAIIEMVIQDRRGLLRLLPALPPQWPEGHLKGILCRGGFDVDVEWKNNRLVEARIKSLRGNVCRIKSFTGQMLAVYGLAEKVKIEREKEIMRFMTTEGETYIVRPDSGKNKEAG